jgi:hypothetical protein
LNQTDPRELAKPRESWADSELSATIKETLRALPEISNAIAANYFAHASISRTGRGSDT